MQPIAEIFPDLQLLTNAENRLGRLGCEN